jgi:hypothetical protein
MQISHIQWLADDSLPQQIVVSSLLFDFSTALTVPPEMRNYTATNVTFFDSKKWG